MQYYTSLPSVSSTNSRTSPVLTLNKEHLPPILSAGLTIKDNRLPSPESPHLIHFNKQYNSSNKNPSVTAASAARSAPPPFLEPAPLTEESGTFQIKRFALDLFTLRPPAALHSNFCFTETTTPGPASQTAPLPTPHVHTYIQYTPGMTQQTSPHSAEQTISSQSPCIYDDRQTSGQEADTSTNANVAILPLPPSNDSSKQKAAFSSSLSPIMAAACASAAAAAAAQYQPNSDLPLQFLDPSSSSISSSPCHPQPDKKVSVIFTNEPHSSFQQTIGLNESVSPIVNNFTITEQQAENKQQQKQQQKQYPPNSVDHSIFLRKDAHIKRPRNAWIHFRCHYGQALKALDSTLRAEEVSKRASIRWSLLSREEKKPWHGLAEQEKQAHREAFPEYRYSPRRSTTLTSATTSPSSSTSTTSLSLTSSSYARLPRRQSKSSDHPLLYTKRKVNSNNNNRKSPLQRHSSNFEKQTRQSSTGRSIQ